MNRRSQASTIGTPMPATGPLMAATIGLGTDSRYVYVPRRSSPHDGVARRGVRPARRTALAPRGASRRRRRTTRQVVHVGAGAEAPCRRR